MLDVKNDKAVKHDEELAKLEAEVVAQPVEEEAVPVEQSEEITPVEESAPDEEEITTEEEPESTEPASEVEEEDLTEEEENSLSEKTRRQMSKLREEARRSKELEAELEGLKRQNVSREPLEQIKEAYIQDVPESGLPWNPTLTVAEATKIARQEVERERKLARIGEDADFLENSYLELNPNNEAYDPDLAQDIYDGFQLSFLADDNLRLKDYAEKKLNLLRKVAERTRQELESKAKVTKQSAEQALPVNVAPAKPRVTVEDQIHGAKTIAELEALEKRIR